MSDSTASHEPSPIRVPFVAACELRFAGGSRSALIRNLSSGGLFLHLEEAPTGEAALHFQLPDGESPVTVRAAVRWSKESDEESAGDLPMGCGFRFVEVPPAEQARIDRVVADYAAQPTPLAGVAQPLSGAARVPVIASCRVAGAFGEASGHTCNLSIFGVYAALSPIPPVDEPVELRLVLPGDSEPFARRAVVTWCNPDGPRRPHFLPAGCGLRFADLSLADVRLLSSIVDGYLARLPRKR